MPKQVQFTREIIIKAAYKTVSDCLAGAGSASAAPITVCRMFRLTLPDMVKLWQLVSGGPVQINFSGYAARLMK